MTPTAQTHAAVPATVKDAAAQAAAKKAENAKLGASIKRAVTQPGATGAKGFLIWVRAAFPKPIADAIWKRASQLQAVAKAKPHNSMMGALGQTATLAPITITAQPEPLPSVPASSAPATPSWVSSIESLLPTAAQAYLTAKQVQTMQSITNINLQRAQQGLAPIATNPADYGLPGPQVGVGLTSGTQNLLIYGGVAVLGVIVLTSVMKSRRSH